MKGRKVQFKIIIKERELFDMKVRIFNTVSLPPLPLIFSSLPSSSLPPTLPPFTQGNLHLDNNRFCTSASNFAGQAYLSLLVAAGGLQLGLRDNDYLLFSSFTCIVGLLGITIYRESYPYVGFQRLCPPFLPPSKLPLFLPLRSVPSPSFLLSPSFIPPSLPPSP